MKGLVFHSLAELVEESYGLATWNRVINSIDSVVDGAYVASDSYPAGEAKAIVAALSQELDVGPATLLDLFGRKLFGDLYAMYPGLVDRHTELLPFLASVGTDVHEQMKITHVDAEVPELTHQMNADGSMDFYYDSPRQLCLLAEGLIRGAAQHFDTNIELKQHACMHDGANRCEFSLSVAR